VNATAESYEPLAQRFFAAIERGDVDALRQIYSPDAVVWHNYDEVEQGLDANLATMAWLSRKARELRYTDVRRTAVEGGFLQQHVLLGVAPDGTAFRVPAILRVWCDADHVMRIEEYLDSAQVQALTRR